MSKSDIKEFILLAFIILLEIISLCLKFFGSYVMNGMQYAALVISIICAFLFYFKRNLYRYVLGVALITTLFVPSSFFIATTTVQIIFFRINIVSLVILIWYLFLYKDRIFHKLSNPSEEVVQEAIRRDERKKHYFKRRFESLSNREIQKKLEMDLVNSAKEALLEIQAERKLATSNE